MDQEKSELLATGKVSGYRGYHIGSVNDHPELAGDPRDITFKTDTEHFEVHGRNWRNSTAGDLIDQ